MTTSISSSAALAVIEPAFSEAEKLALTGFLAGYSGMTGEAYALDLRQVAAWCRQRQRRLFAVRCADIEQFARDLEAAGLGTAAEHALVSLLALNGLRVSEATGANIEALGTERGHRNLAITRKGRQSHHPAPPGYRTGDRPGHRRALRRTDLHPPH